MDESDLSELSSSPPPPSDDEMPAIVAPVKSTKKTPSKKKNTILSFVESSPPRKKRPASPPHEEVLADNPDIAFIVMFRSRFNDAFPPKCPQLGPQDIERGVVDPLPSSQVESLLCALLGLMLNRKKPVEKGHYGRALEEAIQTQKSQWPRAWGGVNPLHGGRSFNTMGPQERLTLLKALILWSLHGSEAINSMLKESYKQSRHDDDMNQPLSVQPWGRDGDKRRYFLVEGKDDTSFRVYREYISPATKHSTWWSVAGSIDDLRVLAKKLVDGDGTQYARKLSEKILNAIPRFEATEEKRKRREYRLARKAAFTKPEPGFSLYEGRTRGKRMRYTFSDEEDFASDDTSGVRRSARQSGADTPAQIGPTVTASGRHVRSRMQGTYGESLLSGQTTTERASPATGEYERSDASEEPHPAHSRATRANVKPAANGWTKSRKHIETYNELDEMDDEDDATSSGGEWDGGDEDDADQMDVDEEEDEFSDEMEDREAEPRSLVVRLKYAKSLKPASTSQAPTTQAPATTDAVMQDEIAVTPKVETPLANGTTGPILIPHAQIPSQPPAPVPQHAAPVPQHSAAPILNGVLPQQTPAAGRPVTEMTPASSLKSEPSIPPAPPQAQPQYSAPTPPYNQPEDVTTKPPFATTLPTASTTIPVSAGDAPT